MLGDLPDGMEDFDKEDFISNEKVIFAAVDYCLYPPAVSEGDGNDQSAKQSQSGNRIAVGL